MSTIVTKNIAFHHFDDAKEAYKSYSINDNNFEDLLLAYRLAIESKIYLDLYKQDNKLKLEDLKEETKLIKFLKELEEEFIDCLYNNQ